MSGKKVQWYRDFHIVMGIIILVGGLVFGINESVRSPGPVEVSRWQNHPKIEVLVEATRSSFCDWEFLVTFESHESQDFVVSWFDSTGNQGVTVHPNQPVDVVVQGRNKYMKALTVTNLSGVVVDIIQESD